MTPEAFMPEGMKPKKDDAPLPEVPLETGTLTDEAATVLHSPKISEKMFYQVYIYYPRRDTLREY